MHFSKILLPFLAALALAQHTDNDNDDDNNNGVANPSPITPAFGDGPCYAFQMASAELTSRAASLTTSMMPGSTNAAGTGDNHDNDDDNNESSSMSPIMNMMSSSMSLMADILPT